MPLVYRTKTNYVYKEIRSEKKKPLDQKHCRVKRLSVSCLCLYVAEATTAMTKVAVGSFFLEYVPE